MADQPDASHLTTLESEDLQALGRPNPGDVAGRFPLLLTTSFSLESCCHCFTPAGMELHCPLHVTARRFQGVPGRRQGL